MTRLFRSKSCGLVGLTEFNTAPPPSSFFNDENEDDEDEDKEGEKEDEEFEEEEEFDEDEVFDNPMSTPFISAGCRGNRNDEGRHFHGNHNQSPILDVLVAALRKSLVTCSVEREDVASSMDISWPTEVRHVSHVTFDRFNGFLGLPSELEPELPRRVPSARSPSSSSSSSSSSLSIWECVTFLLVSGT